MEIIEKTGPTVEAAVKAGVEELGVTPDQVMVEVIEEPNRGLLGIGAKPARVRIIFMGQRPSATEKKPAETQPKDDHQARRERPQTSGDQPQRRDDGRQQRDSGYSRQSGNRRDGGRNNDRGNRRQGGDRRRDDRRPQREMVDTFSEPAPDELPDDQVDAGALVGREVLAELLARMGMEETQVGIRKAEPTRDDEETHWVLNVSGKNVNRLIGRRGETLASLQYVTRLIVSRKHDEHVNLIVDAGQYKDSRSEKLVDLAERMAERAVEQNRTITMEPMPPNERRIIHLALRERDDVETKSVGEGHSRKVTITPITS
ncbi:MAG: Jag N-terminal domain-containing protein [Anaerolineaceae bacterium]|nr:Jag N-terminal domain-containing protein [Anaerolineaceae bacterium]